jgi:hypothetical protein
VLRGSQEQVAASNRGIDDAPAPDRSGANESLRKRLPREKRPLIPADVESDPRSVLARDGTV